jgi:drug/metabolite transporter superfamily protein YnfA
MMRRVSETTRQRQLKLSSVLPVWVLAVVGVVLVLTLVHETVFAWLLLVMVACVLLSFVLQLATQEKDGLVGRISAASSGAFVVVLVGTLVVLFGH